MAIADLTPARLALTPARLALCVALLAPLAGCMSDSASFLIDGDNKHTITVLRNQDFFWKKTVNLSVVPTRLPECQESIKIKDVPRDAEMTLYWAPDDFAEPIHILDVEGEFYALSTRTCKSQHFEAKPTTPGTPVGVFKEQDGHLVFVPAKTTPAP
jgi:hypothetical protein